MRALILMLALASPATTATATPTSYALQPALSSVGFETDFGPDLITGAMPVKSADLVIDFDRLQDCTIDVLLDVSGAQASFPFAAQAMKGPKVLDSASYPEMSFTSTAVRPPARGRGWSRPPAGLPASPSWTTPSRWRRSGPCRSSMCVSC